MYFEFGLAWLFQKKAKMLKDFVGCIMCLRSASNSAIYRKYGFQTKSCHLRTFEMQDATHISIKLHFTSNENEQRNERKKKCRKRRKKNYTKMAVGISKTKWAPVYKVKTRLHFSTYSFQIEVCFGVEQKKQVAVTLVIDVIFGKYHRLPSVLFESDTFFSLFSFDQFLLIRVRAIIFP